MITYEILKLTKYLIKKLVIGITLFDCHILVNNQLEFNQFFSATVNENNLHIFLDDNTHMVYNKGSFELLSTGSFPENLINIDLSYGLFESQIVDGNIFYICYAIIPTYYIFKFSQGIVPPKPLY